MIFPGRRSVRLKEYDYTQSGAYFVTVCTQSKKCILGEITDGEMKLNEAGEIVKSIWEELPVRYHSIGIDYYVIMPNHFHGIIVIQNVGAQLAAPVGGQAPPQR